MIRWIRRLTLLGACAALIVGGTLFPWATWINLDYRDYPFQVSETALEMMRLDDVPRNVIAALLPLEREHFADRESSKQAISRALGKVPGGYQDEDRVLSYCRNRSEGCWSEKKPKDQPICSINAYNANGDFNYHLFLYRHRTNGNLLGIAGDPDVIPIIKQGTKFAIDQVEYEVIESRGVRSPFYRSVAGKVRNSDTGSGGIPLFPWIVLAILLLVVTMFLRSKVLTTLLVLPALVCGIYPLWALRHFVDDASLLKTCGIVLEPAIGVGSYIMLAGGVLAAIGGIIVWFEPAPAPRTPAAETTTST